MKVNVWVIDDIVFNYELVIGSFPTDAVEYCNFYHFTKGMDALSTIKKALVSKDSIILPDIVFVDFYIEEDGWTGNKLIKLIIQLYKKYKKMTLKPHIIAFSSTTKRNHDMMEAGAHESVDKVEIGGRYLGIVNNFYDRDSILTYLKPRFYF